MFCIALDAVQWLSTKWKKKNKLSHSLSETSKVNDIVPMITI